MTATCRKTTIAVVVFAAATFGMAQTASGFACSNTSDTTTECKQLRACAKELMSQASKYAINLQKQLLASIDSNLAGKSRAADGGKQCVAEVPSGSLQLKKIFVGQKCFANKGACKDGARKNLPCDEDFADCPGYCKNDPTKLCWVDHPDCNPSPTFDRNFACVKPGLGACKMDLGFATTTSCTVDAECASVPNSKGVCSNAGVGCQYKKTIGCNEGKCEDGLAGATCSGGVCNAPAATAGNVCLTNSDCAPTCTVTKDCFKVGLVGPCSSHPDTDFLCEVNQRKGIAAAIAKAAADVRKQLSNKRKCPQPPDSPSVNLSELGLPTDLCKGTCSLSFNQCSASQPCGGSEGNCLFGLDDAVRCITRGQAGDLKNATSADSLTRPISKLAFLTLPLGVKEKDAVAPRIPRVRSNISLPNLIQIGAKSSSDGAGSAGGSAPLGMARCKDAGEKTGSPCALDKDCAVGFAIKPYKAGGKPNETALCVPDCCTCTGAGTCDNLDDGSIGSTPNFPSAAAAQCTAADTAGTCTGGKCVGSRRDGLPCDVNADCPASIICETRGNTLPPGNILSLTENRANFVSSCLLTRLGRLSHTTTGLDDSDKGVCAAGPNVGSNCDRDSECGGGACVAGTCAGGPNAGDSCFDVEDCSFLCEGGLTAFGTVNLHTGDAVSNAPINTEVYLGSGASGDACPHCVSDPASPTKFSCDSGANVSGMCLGPVDDTPDEACRPGASWIRLPGVPNPFNLNTGKTQITAVGGKFCGFCSLKENIGCSLDGSQPCPPGAGTCTAGGSDSIGFRGDPGYDDDPVTPGQQATSRGIPDPYAPTLAGVFCTGKVDPSLVDPNIGLPGPVRVLQPLLANYTFTK
jgi:hypothetical protein